MFLWGNLFPEKEKGGGGERVFFGAKEALMSEALPESSPLCEHCAYRKAAQKAEAG